MGKYVIARELGGKSIVSTDGKLYGRVADLVIDEKTGKIEKIIIDPNPGVQIPDTHMTEEGYAWIPFDAVISVSDYMIVDHRKLWV